MTAMQPVGPGRWQAPNGQILIQAIGADGQPAVDGNGQPVLVPEPAQAVQLPPQYAPQPQVVYMQGPGGSVSKTKKDTSHTFHLIMSVITLGTWAVFVWIPITIWHKVGPKKKTVTRSY